MEERARILKMLEGGKINAEEAEKLLQSIDKKMETPDKPKKIILTKGSGKKLKIRVESNESGKENVNISIPLSLAKLVAGFIPKEQQRTMEAQGIDLNTILGHIEELESTGEDIVNVDSDNEKVRIYIE
ncbi:MAG: hypothetical protein PHE49_05570 [bacterium]|nr:hypothetical protein [bacterium]